MKEITKLKVVDRIQKRKVSASITILMLPIKAGRKGQQGLTLENTSKRTKDTTNKKKSKKHLVENFYQRLRKEKLLL